MGLDVVALSNVKYFGDDLDDPRMDSKYYISGCDDQEDLLEGYYGRTARSKRHSFRVGSYSWAGAWDGHLSYAIHGVPKQVLENSREKYEGSAFYELLSADEAIGPKTSAKLARDFAEHSERVREYVKHPVAEELVYEEILGSRSENLKNSIDPKWFLKTYRNWHKACEIGAQAGIVILC